MENFAQIVNLRDTQKCASLVPPTGIHFSNDGKVAHDRFLDRLEYLELHRCVDTHYYSGDGKASFSLCKDFALSWVPNNDTTQLSRYLDLDPVKRADDLECEILLTMLAAPRQFEFPSYEEFRSAVRIRCNIVSVARRTRLAFHTSNAERPDEFWSYNTDHGFTVLPGKSIIAALEKATQPESSNKIYSFSCYRATEYVTLLAIAQELAVVNPELLNEIQRQWEKEPIMSRKFHDIFLHEYGSMDAPVPLRFYIPGDRVWFRNPDDRSSDVTGYEGSWVFYLGGGLFSNFWKSDKPYTLEQKCVEIYHWRHGAYLDRSGELRMDEATVEANIDATYSDPERVKRVVEKMLRLRDANGVYTNGGCIDASREFPKFICPGSAQIVLPTA